MTRVFKRTSFDYSKLDKDSFTDELQGIDWMNIALLPTVHEAAKVFSNQLMSVARKCMPVKEITVR